MDELNPAALMDKTALVTGATDGIGRQTALELARLGANVIVHGRSRERALESARWIAKSAQVAEPKVMVADFASLKEVHAMGTGAAESLPSLDILVNNAGTYFTERSVTEDGIEATFAINHLAPFLLTNLLQPCLARARHCARVVTVSSVAHVRALLEWDNLQSERSFSAYGSYASSKLCNLLFAFEFAKRVSGASIASNALHPGVITTKLLMKGFGTTGASLESGAQTSVYLASSPEAEGITGAYFSNCRRTPASVQARDAANQAKLWEISCELCGWA